MFCIVLHVHVPLLYFLLFDTREKAVGSRTLAASVILGSVIIAECNAVFIVAIHVFQCAVTALTFEVSIFCWNGAIDAD